MNDEPFMDLAVQVVRVLELSGERAVNPDVAVAMLEQVAATLHELEPAAKSRFLQFLRNRAARASTAAERETIEHIPAYLGLT